MRWALAGLVVARVARVSLPSPFHTHCKIILETMRRLIRDALDIVCFISIYRTNTNIQKQLSSPRSSVDKQANALQSLEGVLAQTLLNEDETSKLARVELFVNLQDEFDSNSAC